MDRDLSKFRAEMPLQLKAKIAIWSLIQNCITARSYAPSSFKISVLRLFGAKIGKSVYIRRGVRVHFPWNLIIGEHSWIGEQVWFVNHAPIHIGSNVCISQNSMICSSSHNYKTQSLEYMHEPIVIHDGAWICLDVNILAGADIGRNSVVSAGETFSGVLLDNHIFIKNKITPINYAN